MKNYFYFIVLVCILSVGNIQDTLAQGCVAIRNGGATCTHEMDPDQGDGSWKFNASYRYYKSYKHYRGKEEQKERVELGSDVRNYTNFLDLSISKTLTDRWGLVVNLPIQSTKRTSLYEHDGKTRHATSATGIGDLMILTNYWLFPTHKKANVQLGLGLKLPTGDYNYQDYFFKNDTTYSFGAVDQSIQPGDGGTGFATELNTFYSITKSIGLYGNFYYLFNPRDQNGTLTTRGGTASATAIKYRTHTMSVPDQYMFRAGANYSISKFTVSAGARIEGIPSEDLIGESNGFRRPGYVVAIEPSISYMYKNINIFAAVPVPMYRNRVQSVSDKQRTIDSGTFTQGDAAFADYSLNFGISYRFLRNSN